MLGCGLATGVSLLMKTFANADRRRGIPTHTTRELNLNRGLLVLAVIISEVLDQDEESVCHSRGVCWGRLRWVSQTFRQSQVLLQLQESMVRLRAGVSASEDD